MVLTLFSWWLAWLGPEPFSEHTFFPLWLGYILTVDGFTARRTGTSLLARGPGRFALLFLFSLPLWWLFEIANRYLGNWRYLLPRPYHPVEYGLLASLAFSTVMPAIFVTAELLRTFSPLAPERRWLRIDPGRKGLAALAVTGLAMFALSLALPRVLFPLVWIGLFLALDPINALLGNPSIAVQVRTGRWDTVLVLFAAGLTCGLFWEFWSVLSMPKWVYTVPFAAEPHLFEMPILGYGGYLPFALEVFAAWAFLQVFDPGRNANWLRFTQPYQDLTREESVPAIHPAPHKAPLPARPERGWDEGIPEGFPGQNPPGPPPEGGA
ncbi:MAG: hypothetical protein H0V00_00155 [Chloroflexia bacterium]|nr:hypothetical protein [Chloroflexia bacterium]